MTTIREVLIDLVFNAFLQIGFFAVVAAVFSSFVAKAKAKYQHSFYLGVLILCLAAPVINTLWHTHRSVIAEKSQQDAVHRTESSDHYFWIWKGRAKAYDPLELGAGAESVIIVIWGALVLYQLIHFGRGLRLSASAAERRLAAFSCRNQNGSLDGCLASGRPPQIHRH